MSIEIERRFLVSAEAIKDLHLGKSHGAFFRQGYITSTPDETTCRVRITDSEAWLTIKGKAVGASRQEFEFPIDLAQARDILQTLTVGSTIEKTRYHIPHGGLIWELDVFQGQNDGLIIAEVELDDENQAVNLPSWIGPEITTDTRYSNASLAKHPFTQWCDKDIIDPT